MLRAHVRARSSYLGRALQKEMADGFRDATPVAVSGSVSAPEMKLVVEAAVSESESVDGDFFPPVWVTELPSQADDRLQGSVVGSGVGGGPLRLPLPEEEGAVDGSGLAVLQRRRDVHFVVMECTLAQAVCSLVAFYAKVSGYPDDGR